MTAKLGIGTTRIDGLWTVETPTFADSRGSVMEFYRQSAFEEVGLPSLGDRPQTNAPITHRGGLRGVHAEAAHKYVVAASGSVFAAIVDLRPESATAGQHQTFTLERGQGLFVSSGLGNSFQVTSWEPAVYLYLFGAEWYAGMPGRTCNALDPELGIPWPIRRGMIISEKDQANPSLAEALAL